MKAKEWELYFAEQREAYGKSLFTIHELLSVADTSVESLNVELSRLTKRGIVRRYARGTYGLPEGVSAEMLLPYLDRSSYITGFTALHLSNLVTQVPRIVSCFTNRRHGRLRKRLTPIGEFVFTCVSNKIYLFPEDGVIAAPEQALFDYVYSLKRESLHAKSLVTFVNLDSLDPKQLIKLAPRYPGTVRKQVSEILSPQIGE